MLKDFKAFIMRGNVLDLAVAVVIGAAFGAIVKSLVDDVIMPPIGLALGDVNFTNMFVVLEPGPKAPPPYATLADAREAGAVTVNYGVFINNVVSFLAAALGVFLLVRLAMRIHKQPAPPPPNTKECPFCKNDIPKSATRCGHCTSQLEAA